MMDYVDKFVENMNFNQNKPIREIVYEGLRKAFTYFTRYCVFNNER